MKDPGDIAADVIQQRGRLEADRTTFMVLWQDVANYMLPNRNDYLVEKTPGQKRMQYIYDSTPVWANEQLAAGLHSLLTSPSLQWFSLATHDDKLNRNWRVRAWLDDTALRLYRVFNSPEYNFASESHPLYLDLASIGTAAMSVLESPRTGISFATHHLRDCAVAENEEGRVDTLIRKWKWTAKQAWQKWGRAAGPQIADAMEKTPERAFTFLHRVAPRLDRDPTRFDGPNKPWESAYVCEEGKNLIAQGGFNEFPYLVPRFSKVTGEVYGRGPGMTMLPDSKMLNEMVRTVLKGAQKVVDPPLQMPDDGFLVPLKTTPGGINFYRAGMRPTDRIEAIKTDGDIRLGVELLTSLKQQIIRGFYVEWLMMPSDPSDPAASGKGVTATYVLQQRDEKMRLLSPMVARLQSEFLGPLIDRVFAIMWRKSVAVNWSPDAPLAPPPQEMSGVRMRVTYVSPLDVAQRTSRLDGVGRLVQTQQLLRTVDPQAPMILHSERIMRLTGDDLNTPALALKSPDEVKADAQAQAQAVQQMQQMEAAKAQGKAFRDGAEGVNALAAAGGGLQALGGGAPPMQEAA